MLPLVKWSPFRELTTLHKDIDDLFNRVFGRTERWMPMPFLGGLNYPSIDFVKEGNNLVVHVDLPGIDPKDVDISVTGNTLTVKGERRHEKERKEEDYLVREIGYGAFERSFTLPAEVNPDKIKANSKNGVLYITMPAIEAIKGKRVRIETEEEPKKLKAA